MTSQFTEQDLASMEGPRALKEPGSTEWSWQTVSALQYMWQSLHLNYEHYMSVLSEAEEHRIWEKIPPDAPYGSKEAMLAQVEVGDAKDAQKKMRVQTLAAQARALQKRGRPAGKEKHYHDNVFSENEVQQRPSNAYLLVRIARDYPDVFQRVIDGEFESVRAAAREAGIALAQPKKTVTLGGNVDRVADVLRTYYQPEQVQRIIARLSANHESDEDDEHTIEEKHG